MKMPLPSASACIARHLSSWLFGLVFLALVCVSPSTGMLLGRFQLGATSLSRALISPSRSFSRRVRRRPAAQGALEGVDEVRVRFAPSPTGSLHVGGARTALFNWLLARKANGKFILRIEDTDQARSTRESEESMLEDLRWLGLNWDEGPGVGGEYGPYRQSERGQIYQEMAKKLMEAGHAYPCFCTEEELEAKRQEAEAKGEAVMYDGTWRDADPAEAILVARRIDAGEAYTVRFKVPKGAKVSIDDVVRGRVSWDAEATVGDFILLRSTGVPVYNFCVAVDDALMKISHVVRAEEHLTNTLRQGLILEALGFDMPRYAHCSLILGEDRSKLSKRHGATSIDQFRRQGFLRDAMINYLAALGWNDGTDKEIYTIDEIIQAFSLERVVRAPSMFDMTKLRWMNGQHLRQVEPVKLEPLMKDLVQDWGLVLKEPSNEFISLAVQTTQEKLEMITDAREILENALKFPFVHTMTSSEAQSMLEDGFHEIVQAVIESYDEGGIPVGTEDDFEALWKSWVKGLGKRLNRKGKRLFHPLRVAVTGTLSGPDIGAQLRLVASAEGQVPDLVAFKTRIEMLRNWLVDNPPRSEARVSEIN